MTRAEAFAGIRACVFDAYGTLFDVSAATARCRDELGDRADALTTLWRSKQLEYSWLRSLRGDYVDFWHVTGQSLDYALAALGLRDPALRSRLMELYFVLDAFPDARNALIEIKSAGLKTAILSNGSLSMLTAAAHRARLDDLLDAVISVDSVRIYKPHPTV
jgi:2-haloacid dehalogenase